jgi:proline iminopeptidase
VRPTHVRDGFAVYAIGSGEPVLHMLYPHAAAVAGDRTLTALVRGLEALGWQVVRFDPPGAGRSTRPMRLDLPEMLECAQEALAVEPSELTTERGLG